jgi:hypothetical protein
MSLVTKKGRVSVKPTAKVPPLGGLPGIVRASATTSVVSSRRGIEEGVDLSEGCLVTKSIKYTHQLAHWISAVREGDPTGVVSRKFIGGY